MKAPAFAYAKPASLAEVFDCLESNQEARVIAGGQSLIPALNMRLLSPSLLIDLNGIAGLSGISETDGAVRIGATTRYCDILDSQTVAKHLPLIAKAIPHIAHHAIRNRGTIGGSLALADPSTELPACCLALDATIVVASRLGERQIASRDFFKGIYETALQAGDVLLAIEFPAPQKGAVSGFAELARRHGDYAMVGLAAHGMRAGSKWASLQLAFFGVGDRPLLAHEAARIIVGGGDASTAGASLERDLSPSDDGECAATTKMHMARVLLGRVMAAMEADPS